MDWLSVVIEEYRTLRAESLESIKNQQSTLNIGTATMGIIVATGFNFWDKILLFELIFLLFNPLLCYLVLMIWMGEVARMMRAGFFISRIEEKVNKEFPERENGLSWEKWLRSGGEKGKTPQMKWNYRAILMLFLGAAASTITIGLSRLTAEINPAYILIIAISEAAVFVIFFRYFYKLGKLFQTS